MSRASDAVLDAIHALVAGSLKDELIRAAEAAALPPTIEVERDGKTVTEDNPGYRPLNPQLIDKALKFLKDNGVDAPAKSERVDNLAATLADLDIDEAAHDLRTAH